MRVKAADKKKGSANRKALDRLLALPLSKEEEQNTSDLGRREAEVLNKSNQVGEENKVLTDAKSSKRIYRKKSDLPNPQKSHRDNKNRTKLPFSIRLSEEFIRRVDFEASSRKMTRQEFVESILRSVIS